MTELHKQRRYDRMSEDYVRLTGETPTSSRFLHAAEFTRPLVLRGLEDRLSGNSTRSRETARATA
jgi:hypothetical protein